MSTTLRATAVFILLLLVLSPGRAVARQQRDTIRGGATISAEELHRQRREWLERQRLGQLGRDAPAFGSAIVGAPRAGQATGIATGPGIPASPFGFDHGALRCSTLVFGGGWPGGWWPGQTPFGALGFQGHCVPASPWWGGAPRTGLAGSFEPGLSRSFGSTPLPYPAYPPVGRFYDRFHRDDDRVPRGGFGPTVPYGGFGSPLQYAGFGPPSLYGGFGSTVPYGGFGSTVPYGGFGPTLPYGGFGPTLPYGGFGPPPPYDGFGAPLPFGGIQEYGWGPYGPWRSYPGGTGWTDGAYGWSFSPGRDGGAGVTECVEVTLRTAPGREHRIEVGLQALGLADARDLDLAIDARLSRGESVVLYGLDGRMLRIEPGAPIDDILVRPCGR